MSSKKEPYEDSPGGIKLPPFAPHQAPSNRTMRGISDLTYSEPGCCCCDNKFEGLKIYGDRGRDVGLICRTCAAKYNLAETNQNSTEALKILYELVNQINGQAQINNIRSSLNVIIKMGLPK